MKQCTKKRDCSASSHYGDCKSMPYTPDLAVQLAEVDRLFSNPYSARSQTYNYSLGRFPNGWNFKVTNNWYRWSDRGLMHEFGVFEKPQQAVQAFLDYVEEQEISVADLMGDVHADS